MGRFAVAGTAMADRSAAGGQGLPWVGVALTDYDYDTEASPPHDFGVI